MKSKGDTKGYKVWRNMCVKMLKKNKKIHFQSLISRANGNARKIWAHINMLSKDRDRNNLKALNINGKISTDKQNSVSNLNSDFVNATEKLVGNEKGDYIVPVILKKFKIFAD